MREARVGQWRVNLQYNDDEETAGEILVSIHPVDQGCMASLQQHIHTHTSLSPQRAISPS